MTVSELSDILEAKLLCGDGSREVTGVYTGDLLSWVIAYADCGDAGFIVMKNINMLAVASLTDVACIIIAEDSEIEDGLVDRADAKDIALLATEKGSAELVWTIAHLIGKI